MIACPGSWKNFAELEEHLSLPEILQILDSFRQLEKDRFRSQAALQGIDIDNNKNAGEDFEAVKRRALAKTTGVTEEEIELNFIGITVEEL